MKKIHICLTLISCSLISVTILAQDEKYKEAIYMESDVPEYELPDVLRTFDNKKIKSSTEWETVRRPEVMKFFEENLYGKVPKPVDPVIKTFELVSEDKTFLDGLCTKKHIIIRFKNSRGRIDMPMLVFIPNDSRGPVPAIYLVNLQDIQNNRFEPDNPQGYGKTQNGIPLKQLMLRGIALVSIDAEALGDRGKSQEEILDGRVLDLFFQPGQNNTKDNEWGLIAIWAYAMSSGMDYIVTDKDINPTQVAILGCSIGGKVALWAAVNDPRIGMVLSATTGHGGDALWRREFGETLENMSIWLPRWLCRNAAKYAGKENEMPVDQHMLLACLAPRPLYVSNAKYDYWADNKGEWLATYHAAPVYKLYGSKIEFKSVEQPGVNQPIVKSDIGYHLRTGFHGLLLYDWERYMEFIEYHFMKIPIRSVHDIYHPDGELFDHYPNKLQESHIVK
jgi:hypothetical protein